MLPKRIMVMGASAGGFSTFRRIFSDLDPSISAAVLAVLHTTVHSSGLAHALGTCSRLPVRDAAPGPIEAGSIYVAPPNYHLMVQREGIQLFNGPRENMHRPSVDVLFRSAAFAFRSRVIGVVLSGMLDDGTAGLFQIKRHGGTAVIQDPDDAEFNSMPLNACAHVKVDYVLTASKIGPLLNRLARDQTAAIANEPHSQGLNDMIDQDVKSGQSTS
jgi:two-component system, chemotaxis family, protein-glutamate methylesterase/glutaminase